MIDSLVSEDSDVDSVDEILRALDKERTRIVVSKATKSYNKPVTVISGLQDIGNAESVTKELKKKIGTGGTYKDGQIILQGDHRDRVKEFLISKGFNKESIEIL